jgi:hypothetical protein
MRQNFAAVILILTLVQCSPGTTINQCAVEKVAPGTMAVTVHPQVKNSPQYNDSDPSNDLDALDQSLSRVPGEYTTSIKIGPKGTPVDVVADSGSAFLLIGTDSYAPTGSPVGAPFSAGYGGGGSGGCSAQASNYTASVGLMCGGPINQTIASYSTTSDCPNILGLSYGALTDSPTFFGDLVRGQKVAGNVFSMVLCGRKTGSQIVLGGVAQSAPMTIQYTPIVQEAWYVVNAVSLAIQGGASLGNFPPSANLTSGTAIIDTGTTLALLPQSMFDAVVSAMRTTRPDLPVDFFSTNNPSNPHYVLTPGELGDITKLPTLTLTFSGGVSLTIPPSVYIKDLDGNNFVFGFRPSAAGDPGSILGQSVLDQQIIIFDRQNAKIGFASAANVCTD